MKYISLAFALAALVFVGCGKKEPPPSAKTPATAVPAAKKAKAPAKPPEAKEIFATRCATCHGTTGKGDGPAGMVLNPRPRSFGDAAWQAKVTDEHLKKVIVEGGASVGLSPLMAPNPDLAAHPTTVDGLVKLIRSYKAAN